MTPIEIIDQHVPSLTDDDEALIEDHARDWLLPDPGYKSDAADLALRTCHCGVKIDGFYEYVDHLKEELRKEGISHAHQEDLSPSPTIE